MVTPGTWTDANNAIKVLAIASDGLYVVDPGKVSATPPPHYAFSAFGHLVVDQGSNQAYATASSTGPNSSNVVDHFDEVVRLDLTNLGSPAFVYALLPGST